jgi:hypothetical protein
VRPGEAEKAEPNRGRLSLPAIAPGPKELTVNISSYHTFPRVTLPRRLSAADFIYWTIQLRLLWGVSEVGLHLIRWLHDDQCVFSAQTVPRLPGRCRCRPHALLILRAGMPNERRIEIVRNGVALPVRPLAEEELK